MKHNKLLTALTMSLIGVGLMVATTQAKAQSFSFSGSVTGTCSITNVQNGALVSDTNKVQNDSLVSSTPGSLRVVNNKPNGFKLSIIQGSMTAPTQLQGALVRSTAPSVSSGPNSGATFTGTANDSTRSVNLAQAGSDSISVAASVRNDTTTLAIGNYTLNYTVTCDAI
jgi:hypothetical protein